MQQELDFGSWVEDKPVQKEVIKKAKEAKKRQVAAKKEMTPEEILAKWKEILSNPKNSKPDQLRLEETFKAWKAEKVFPQGKMSKAEALRMYARYAESMREEKLRNLLENIPSNFHLVQDEKTLDWVCELWTLEEKPVGFDTETTGLDIMYGEDRLVGLSLSFQTTDEHFYLPLRHKTDEKQLDVKSTLNRLKPFFKDARKKKYLHNAKFDAHVMKMEGIKLRGIQMDTMVGMWCLNEEEKSFKLKDLSNRYAKYLDVKPENDTFKELFGKTTFDNIDLKVALVYAAKDTLLTVKLANFIERLLDRKGLERVKALYFDLENPLLARTIEMEQGGFLLNKEKVEVVSKELHTDVAKLKSELINEFGDINFNSPAQLQKALYDDKGFEDVSGKRKTDKHTLKTLADEYPEVELLQNYKKMHKLLTSFIDKLPTLVKSTGRVYGQFNQSATKTGRYASKNPNLQQLPKKARMIFRAPDGSIIIGSDFSQIEPRVLAHITGDEELRKPYLEGYDLYATLAARTFKIDIEYCVDGAVDPTGKFEPRKMMKTGLLAVMYGTSMYTLKKQLNMDSVEEAQQFIDDFYDAYPKVGQWIKSIHEFVKNNEYVETLYGRKRRFPNHKNLAVAYDSLAAEICERLGSDKLPINIWDKKYKTVLPYELKRKFQNVKGKVERVRRQAVNAIIQGSAADIMKRAMLNLADLCDSYEGWKMVGTVHDEALLELPETITQDQAHEIETAMTSAATLEVPLKVDVAFMREWGAETKMSEWFAAA